MHYTDFNLPLDFQMDKRSVYQCESQLELKLLFPLDYFILWITLVLYLLLLW